MSKPTANEEDPRAQHAAVGAWGNYVDPHPDGDEPRPRERPPRPGESRIRSPFRNRIFHNCPANGVPLWPDAPTRAIYTDASSTLSYGAVLSAPASARKTMGGYWNMDEKLPIQITSVISLISSCVLAVFFSVGFVQ